MKSVYSAVRTGSLNKAVCASSVKAQNNFVVIIEMKSCLVALYTELFISPSGTSELDCATTKTYTAERSISIGRETLKVFFCTRGLGVLVGSTARG